MTPAAVAVDATGVARSVTSLRLTTSVNRMYDLDTATADRVVLAGLLLRARELLLRELDTVLSPLGTSHAKYQVLAVVCPEPEGLQLREIAARASVHPTTMTATIDRLVRGGLIERRADPNDRRGILAVATPEGRALYERAHRELSAIQYGLADLDSDTTKSLLDGLDRVAAVLERRDTASE
ncbi:MarR family winged helix-turn-helix transcriptional regulator [Nocardia pseudovaccinii]|uniref:MarR family winged helix-turn-helix transcriptional regulator n=1 Tax=Nocardia pseudovaccinii TaxID=189540 RepID=UPI0007A45760|nr:MarR family transcriptional regulator [Nocardia pseudovaccinii]